MGDASDIIFKPHIGLNHMPFSIKVDSEIAHKMQDFGKYPLMVSNEMLYREEVHSLLVKCFKTFIRYIGQMGGGYGNISVSTTHGPHCMPFPPTLTLKLHTK